MKKQFLSRPMQGNLMLLTAALLWGTTFVAQSEAMDLVEPFSYNAIRTLLGGFVLLPVIALFDRIRPEMHQMERSEKSALVRRSIRGGIVAGLFLFVASSLQQSGMTETSAGKAGFITALYLVLVPVFGIFIHKKVRRVMWLCVAMAIFGFYLLCIKEGFQIARGDLLMFGCAVTYAIHILVIDHFTKQTVDGIRLSCAQFFTAGLLMLVMMALFEHPTLQALWAARWTILYAGIMSSGIAFTLQVLGQQRSEPTTATLIMSLESVFAALSGWLILNEYFTLREGIGCILVFSAVILAQIPLENYFRTQKDQIGKQGDKHA